MKTGATYSFFDCGELLPHSIDCIRNHVDYISIIYQHVSNWGNKNDESVKDILYDLKTSGKVDDVFLYTPKMTYKLPHYNEINKRHAGLESCRNAGCTHFMVMDADELYESKDLVYLLDYVKKHDPETTYSKMLTYYKTPEYILDPMEEYYVGLMYKIHPFSEMKFGHNSPVLIDPTRRISTVDMNNYKVFETNEVLMHHFSYVRNDIKRKLMNSSARVNFNPLIEDTVKYFNEWTPDKKARLIGTDVVEYNIKKVNTWDNLKI